MLTRLRHLFRPLYYRMPVPLRFAVRRLLYLPADVYTHGRRKDAMIPPRGMVFTGSGDFVKTGDRFVGRLQQYTALHAHTRLLDIGCGIGRLARPLAAVLQPPGGYEGFDVVHAGINWCNRHIATRHPHFRFTHVQLFNDLYKLQGADAAQFRFPYTDNRFDTAVAISVFTHMLPHEVANYLAETARVLKPGGRLFATFFVHEPGHELPADFNFPVKHDGYALMSAKVKHANVLFEKETLWQLVQASGLEVMTFVRGRWNYPPGEDLQDTLVLVKP